jgi:hypothetical protein
MGFARYRSLVDRRTRDFIHRITPPLPYFMDRPNIM